MPPSSRKACARCDESPPGAQRCQLSPSIGTAAGAVNRPLSVFFRASPTDLFMPQKLHVTRGRTLIRSCQVKTLAVAALSVFASLATGLYAQKAPTAKSGELRNAIGMEFVSIPAGEFMMG